MRRPACANTLSREPLSEVELTAPGFLSASAVVAAKDVTPELIEQLAQQLHELPRLDFGSGSGAVDIQLEAHDGSQVKSGSVVLEAAGTRTIVPLDAATRRFRTGGLAPGDYELHAASAEAGAATTRFVVREGDVARAAVRLDGSPLEGTTTVRFALRGTAAERVRIRAREAGTGRAIFERRVDVRDGLLEIEAVPFGKIHWEIDDGTARSCYESEENALTAFRPEIKIELVKFVEIEPNPPEPGFAGLPKEFAGVARVLPELGIRSIGELAAVEPEDLMHRALRAADAGRLPPLYNQTLATAVDAARAALGVVRSSGEQRVELRVAAEEAVSRVFVPREAGEAVIEVSLPEGERAELSLELPGGEVETHRVEGSKRLRFTATPRAVAAPTLQVVVKKRLGARGDRRGVCEAAGAGAGPGFHARVAIDEAIDRGHPRCVGGAESGAARRAPVRGDGARKHPDVAGSCTHFHVSRGRVQH